MTTRWYFQPIFDSLWIPVVLGALLLILLFVRPVFDSVSRKRRRILTWLRALVICCVVLAMMQPTVVSTQTKPVAATLAIVVDRSRSMQVEDMGENSRWKAVEIILDQISPQIDTLQESYDVKAFTFSDELTEMAIDDSEFALPAAADGLATDIGAALDGVARSSNDKRLGAVLLLSDGAQRSLAPRVDANQVAGQLARAGTPLFTVTLGKSRDRSQTRDVAIENFEDQYMVFVKNELVVRASLHVQGYVGQRVPVELRVTRPDGEIKTVGPIVVAAEEDSQSLDVSFTYAPPVAGQYQMELSATVQPGERITENNSLGAFLKVLEGGVQVLYLCGNIGWQEHNFIRRSIDQSNDIQLDFRWVDARRRRNWPVDLQSLLDENQYDVFILADVDAAALGKQCALLAAEVNEGKGLMMTGGAHSFAPGGYAETPLAEMMPVILSRFDRQQFDKPVREDVHLPGDLGVRPTAIHFVTRLATAGDQDTVWRRLPPLRGANRLGRPKPTATVLLQTTQEEPILVQGQYGLGRVLAFAGDSTYRWYRFGFQDEHKRFWRQVILWLAQKDDDRASEVWLRLDQRRYSAGARVPFTVGAYDREGTAIDEARFEVTLVAPDGKTTAIDVSRDAEVWSATTPVLQAPGSYSLQATAAGDKQTLGTTETAFIVLDQDLELADATANPALMEMLASRTKDAGGRTVAPEQVGDLVAELKNQPIESTIAFESRWQLTDTPQDAWLVFLVIVGLLSVEWFLRKRWSMV